MGVIDLTLFLLVVIALIIYALFVYQGDNSNGRTYNAGGKCPNCGSSVESRFNVCPICKETLRTNCPNCGEKVSVTWDYCPYCEYSLRKGNNK